MNTIRQCVLASHSYESRAGSLPDFLFDKDPRIETSAGNETSTFLQIATDLTGMSQRESMPTAESYQSISAMLQCPSAPEKSLFDFVPESFTSQIANEGPVYSVDYAFNGGYIDQGNKLVAGAAISRSKQLRKPLHFSNITGGTSNVIHIWESVGGVAYAGPRKRIAATADYRAIVLHILVSKYETVSSTSRDTSAVYSWSTVGPRIGVVDRSLRVNETNLSFGPFSMHAGTVSIGRLDGSVGLLDQSIDSEALRRLIASGI
jgi:hypothetical protein